MRLIDRFPARIYVRNDQDSEGLLVVGDDRDPLTRLDVADGQHVAIYERKVVTVYRAEPRLDPLTRHPTTPKRRAKRPGRTAK